MYMNCTVPRNSLHKRNLRIFDELFPNNLGLEEWSLWPFWCGEWWCRQCKTNHVTTAFKGWVWPWNQRHRYTEYTAYTYTCYTVIHSYGRSKKPRGLCHYPRANCKGQKEGGFWHHTEVALTTQKYRSRKLRLALLVFHQGRSLAKVNASPLLLFPFYLEQTVPVVKSKVG